MEKLTKRQEEILNYIKEYIANHGYPPTVREIGADLGVSSPATIHAHLKNLEEKMPWKKAVDYCQQITIGKMKGSAGSKDFWEILKIQAPKKINELNEFISKLGGEKLEGSYWTSDQNDHNWAYFVLFSNSPKRPSMISAYFKSLKIAVRPILSLT